MTDQHPARRDYTMAERHDRACMRIAMHIRGLWEETGRSDTRLLEGLFLPDAFTVIGHSHNFTGKGRREHVVPRLFVIEKCIEMLDLGQDDKAIAEFIREHVKIIMISDEEQVRLDSRTTGLRQKMPKDWQPGGDIYARLKEVNVEWAPNMEHYLVAKSSDE